MAFGKGGCAQWPEEECTICGVRQDFLGPCEDCVKNADTNCDCPPACQCQRRMQADMPSPTQAKASYLNGWKAAMRAAERKG
jgi:hypothetical protein